jgi:MFS family permease
MKIFAPLRLRDFRILWAGMAVSLVGDGVTLIAIAWQVYLLSDLPTALGTAMMAMSMPQVLLLLFGGMASDRFERRWLMVGADLIRAIALTALGILSIGGVLELWHLTVIAVFYGAGSAFFGPAFDAMVPDVVPEADLAQANAVDNFVRPLAGRLIGPGLGGLIIAELGVGWAFIFDAATFAVSIACLICLGPIQPRERQDSPVRRASMFAEIREGFAYVQSHAWLWGTLIAATLAYFLFLGPSEVLVPHIVKNDLGGTASDLGMVFAIGGLGAVLSSLIMAQRGTPARNMTFIYVVWTISTLSVAGYGFANAIWQAMLVCFIFNFFESAGLIVWLTTTQILVPPRLLGRVSSFKFIAIALMPLSYALAGFVASLVGSRLTLICAGVLGAGATLAFLFLPDMRAPERKMRVVMASRLAAPSVAHQ